MKHKGFAWRTWKREGGEQRRLKIDVAKCPDCKKRHRVLPDFLTPYKHYDSEAIEDVLDEVISEADGLDYPCEITMQRWRGWFGGNLSGIEGMIRSAGYRLLDFSAEFLKSTDSLLEELRKRISPGWLSMAVRFIYNSGGRLVPYPLME